MTLLVPILVGYGAQVLVWAVAQRRRAGSGWMRALLAVLLVLSLLLTLPAISISGGGQPHARAVVAVAYLALQGAIVLSLPALILTLGLYYASARTATHPVHEGKM